MKFDSSKTNIGTGKVPYKEDTQGELAEQYQDQQIGDPRVRNELVKIGDVILRRWQHEYFLMLMQERDDYVRAYLDVDSRETFDELCEDYNDSH